MPITFSIPSPLRAFTSGQSEVQVAGPASTVGEALELLWKDYPGLRDRIMNEQGQVREHINVFVNRDYGREDTAVGAQDRLHVLPAISGG